MIGFQAESKVFKTCAVPFQVHIPVHDPYTLFQLGIFKRWDCVARHESMVEASTSKCPKDW